MLRPPMSTLSLGPAARLAFLAAPFLCAAIASAAPTQPQFHGPRSTQPILPASAGGQGNWIGEPPGNHAPAGINLGALSDWSNEWMFVDLFKQSRPWLPQTTAPDSPWNTGQPLALDPNGWPLLAPGQAAATLMMREVQGKYPGGRYHCFFEGTGQLQFGFDAKVVSSAPGHYEVDVTPSHAGILLRVVSSSANDPVRNIRFVMPGFEHTYAAEPFHPLFLERLAHYRTLRFMDMQRINNSAEQHWHQRTTPTWATQAADHGVALEYLIELSNTLGKHPWVCLPHLATDDYVRQFARVLRDNVHPDLEIHVEYSNEVWNSLFTQSHYARQQGIAAGLHPDVFQAQLKWYSQRSLEIFDLMVAEFGGPGSPGAARLRRVLAGQSGNPFTGEVILDHQQAHQRVDAYSIAPYFGGSFGFGPQVPITKTWSVEKLLQECALQILGPLRQQMAQNAHVAHSRGLPLIAYEGGQHLVGVGSAVQDDALTQLFIEANRHPWMYWLYLAYLDAWHSVGGGTMVAFLSTYAPNKWGSWGTLEHQAQAPAEAHKFRALRDFVEAVQPVGVFGKGCGPMIGSIGQLGASAAPFTVLAGGVAPGTLGVLLVSGQKKHWGSLLLPLGLGPHGAPGCQLLVPGEWISAVYADATGSASVSLQSPTTPQFAGLPVFVQWAFVDTGVGPLGWRTSPGLRAVVQ